MRQANATLLVKQLLHDSNVNKPLLEILQAITWNEKSWFYVHCRCIFLYFQCWLLLLFPPSSAMQEFWPIQISPRRMGCTLFCAHHIDCHGSLKVVSKRTISLETFHCDAFYLPATQNTACSGASMECSEPVIPFEVMALLHFIQIVKSTWRMGLKEVSSHWPLLFTLRWIVPSHSHEAAHHMTWEWNL